MISARLTRQIDEFYEAVRHRWQRPAGEVARARVALEAAIEEAVRSGHKPPSLPGSPPRNHGSESDLPNPRDLARALYACDPNHPLFDLVPKEWLR